MTDARMRKRNRPGVIEPSKIIIGGETKISTAVARPAARQLNELPAIITNEGEEAGKRFLEFFTAQIRNKNTRSAYHRAVCQFLEWCESFDLGLEQIETLHVAAYIEQLTSDKQPATVKQHLAAIKMLFDWFLIGQITRFNPAAAVRGPKHSVSKGKTPILGEKDAQRLLESIETDTFIGLRDRAFIAAMTYTFGRVSAVAGMNVEDYYPNGKRWWLRLKEKGGKQHEMPAHHKLEEYLDAYLSAFSDEPGKKDPLFVSAPGWGDQPTAERFTRNAAYKMVQRRRKNAGIETPLCNHSFRGTGITNFIENGGDITDAQKMAGHATVRTTQLYDRSSDQVTLDAVERISI